MKKIYVLFIILIAIFTFSSSSGSVNTILSEFPQKFSNEEHPKNSIQNTPVQYLNISGINIAYREFGTGDPLLMNQGIDATMDDWNDTFISILASKYRVYIYDYRGMGYSTDNDSKHSIKLYAEDVADFISTLNHKNMSIYGVSMGSCVAQELVINHPEKVKKMILDSSTYSIRIPETKELLGYLYSVISDPTLSEGNKNQAYANLLWNGTFKNLSTIKNDVLVIVGSKDTVTPPILSKKLFELIPNSTMVIINGTNHGGSSKNPEEYAKTTLHFLES
ncbi:MAG: alpha/beta hydrolase [Methanomicrobiales archaeon]|nr:alpha/beta hydrolase [Methanomicrobiales archaeon]